MEAVLSTTRIEQERAGKIRTFTGRYVDPLRLQPSDVDVRDIAHHLSLLCRYTGACPRHYSVAQHAVMASYWPIDDQIGVTLYQSEVSEREFRLAILHHDDGEYVFNDLASPVKRSEELRFYRTKEHATTEMIFARLGIRAWLLPFTKRADDWMFKREVASWWGEWTLWERWFDKEYVRPWSNRKAEKMFLKRNEELLRA